MLVHFLVHISYLEVGFSIKILGLNIAETLGVLALQQEYVSWNEFIIPHLNYLSHLEVSPPTVLEGALLGVED